LGKFRDNMLKTLPNFSKLQTLPNKGFNWYADSNQIIDSVNTIKKDKIIVIKEQITKPQWIKFEELLGNINQQYLIITDGLPFEWVKNSKLTVIQTHSYVRNTLEEFDEIFKTYSFKHFQRKVNLIEKDFFMMYGRWSYHREQVVAELESRSLLDESIYSRPTFEGIKGRSIENAKEPTPDQTRYNHTRNFKSVLENSQKCHCYIVLENNGLLQDTDQTMTEKIIWPILAQTPFILAVGIEKAKKLSDWGILPADSPRHSIRSFTEQVLWLKSEFKNLTRAQKWQDSQGEKINLNLKLLKNLKNVIDLDVESQFRQHGI